MARNIVGRSLRVMRVAHKNASEIAAHSAVIQSEYSIAGSTSNWFRQNSSSLKSHPAFRQR